MSGKRTKVIFVCTANICRSPMAERLLRHALDAEPAPLKNLEVLSAGLSAYRDDPASPNSVRALKSVGIPLDDHQSQPLTQGLVDEALAIFCMTESHRTLIQSYFVNLPEHLYLMREWIEDKNQREINDPYGQSLDAYEACRDSMVEAIPAILRFLRQNT